MSGARTAWLSRVSEWLVRALEAYTAVLMVILAVIVLLGVWFRYVVQRALPWYDEFAEFLLVWLTFYGSALAAHRGAHIGFETLTDSLPPVARRAAAIFAEGVVLFVLLAGGGTPPAVIPLHLFSGAAKFPLLAIPLFILAGGIMSSAGISLRIINMASTVVGHIRGGLGMVNVASSMFFAEISGSAVADVPAIGSIIMPAMVAKGYPAAFTAGLTSVAASLAIIIPPSIPMILYAVIAGTSVTRLFLTGFAPGVIGGLLMMVVVYYKARRLGFPVERAFAARRVVTGIRDAGWTVLLPVIILGGMFGGIVTATEAAGLAVLAAFIIGTFIYREMDFRQLRGLTLDGVVQTATVMLIVAASAVLGWYLTNEQVPQRFAAAVLGLTSNPTIVVLLIVLALVTYVPIIPLFLPNLLEGR